MSVRRSKVMGQKTPVKIGKIDVIKTVDPKYKTSLPGDLKPKLVEGFSKLETDPPKGKKLEPFSVSVSVSLEKTDKGVKVEIKLTLEYGDKMFRAVTGKGGTESSKPGTISDGDVDAVVGPALKSAITGAISEFKKKAADP
jgi:hypothetical protein